MIVGISRAVLEEVAAHVARTPEIEVCGLLLGETGRIMAAQPAENVASDPRARFEIDPTALIAAHRAARSGGPALIGHYHSHPAGPAYPSECDAEHTDSGKLWLILAGSGEMALFEAVSEGPIHGRFRQIEWQTQ